MGSGNFTPTVHIERICHGLNPAKLQHIRRTVQITGVGSEIFAKSVESLCCIRTYVQQFLRGVNKGWSLNESSVETEFQTYLAIALGLQCLTPTHLVDPSQIISPDVFIDPKHQLNPYLGQKLVYTRQNVVLFAVADSAGKYVVVVR